MLTGFRSAAALDAFATAAGAGTIDFTTTALVIFGGKTRIEYDSLTGLTVVNRAGSVAVRSSNPALNTPWAGLASTNRSWDLGCCHPTVSSLASAAVFTPGASPYFGTAFGLPSGIIERSLFVILQAHSSASTCDAAGVSAATITPILSGYVYGP